MTRLRVVLAAGVVNFAWGQTSVSSTTSGISDFDQFYDITENSAINMAGFSYYVNFDTPTGNLSQIARLCYYHPTCVSFDFDLTGTTGWLHRITADCAGSANAEFTNGDSSNTLFYQLKPSVLIAKGLNKTQCSHVKAQFEPDYNTSSMVARLFAATLGTLTIVSSILYLVVFMIKRRQRARTIANVINDEEGMEEDDIPMVAAAAMPRPGQNQHARAAGLEQRVARENNPRAAF